MYTIDVCVGGGGVVCVRAGVYVCVGAHAHVCSFFMILIQRMKYD